MKSLEDIDLTKPYSVTMDGASNTGGGRVVEAKNLEPPPPPAVTLEYVPPPKAPEKEPEADMAPEDLSALPSKARHPYHRRKP